MRRRRGLTLLELLISMTIVAILMGALSRAYVVGIDYDARVRAGRDDRAKQRELENRITELLTHAYLSTDAADTSTYFIAPESADGGADTLTFTTIGDHIPRAVLDSQDDFDVQNERYGPQGGIAEESLSVTPVGNPSDPDGLFLREQRPADGDYTQGGFESKLSTDVTEILFEFWDGTQWITSWDTQTIGKRLPAAVRVSYRLGSNSNQKIFTVRIPSSDVTAENPVTTGATQ